MVVKLGAAGIAQVAETIGGAVGDLSEVFLPNATRAMELEAEIHKATMQAALAEFQHAGTSRFDRAINGLNRLPRPLLALGTLGLFVYAMVDPVGFGQRMIGLDAIPEPLWWLLGAIVSFYFGARELHHFRCSPARGRAPGHGRGTSPLKQAPEDDPVAHNPALSAWRAARDLPPSSAETIPPPSP